MVILGHASIVYGPYGSEKRPEYFVSAEATTLFGMAEGLVDLYGYSGNGESLARASLFDNLEILKTSMIINPQYMDRPIDFPHFVVNEEELRKYGIYDFVKCNQLSHILVKHAEFNRHKFGDNLRRYVVAGFPEEEVYNFGDPGDNEIPTRPNTPFVDEYTVRDSLGEMNAQGGVAMYGKERVVDENTKGEDVEGAGAKMESVE
ncbi:hypothetical protein C8R44DRAFT_755420 [Mycena epipterygia]|nr:hypothetical protein C8R44DRAFT_755420 [Mycena epipterygia]